MPIHAEPFWRSPGSCSGVCLAEPCCRAGESFSGVGRSGVTKKLLVTLCFPFHLVLVSLVLSLLVPVDGQLRGKNHSMGRTHGSFSANHWEQASQILPNSLACELPCETNPGAWKGKINVVPITHPSTPIDRSYLWNTSHYNIYTLLFYFLWEENPLLKCLSS